MSDRLPSDWDSRRKKVYRRDGYTCQHCGAKGGQNGDTELHAHHIVPKSRGGSHHLNNLVTVCRDCHKAIHGDFIAPSPREQLDQMDKIGQLSISILREQKDLLGTLDEFVQHIVGVMGGKRAPDAETYLESRRDIRLGNDRVKGVIENAKKLDTSSVPEEISSEYNQLVRTAEELSENFVECVQRAESCFNHSGRCHICFEEIDRSDEICSECGAELDTSEVEYREDGRFDADPLVNDLSDYLTESADLLTKMSGNLDSIVEKKE
ncbi:HNH endonuclease [Halostella salina]|uniref:HNH endonuclease n=1 Tax=Halostella salina TaxID=1547897 RepID=UPI000EF81369|nr:HNH endonuclease [Halostella salina]